MGGQCFAGRSAEGGLVPVYFIQAGQGGPIKIGSARYPELRIGALQVANHEELTLLGKIRYDDGHDRHSEWAIHEYFSEHRLRGEWFRPDWSILRFIENNCGKEASR